jgi:DNA (cytosine-5)-methyltransferase 1
MREKTNGAKPRFAVWENVPGAYSSNKGEDFRQVLQSFCEIADEAVLIPKSKKWLTVGSIVGNGYSLAWRTLDAQYFGVAQRRRRCYLVVDFGSERASEILFDSESVSGNFAESCKPWSGTSKSVEIGSGTAIAAELGAASRLGGHIQSEKAYCLRADAGDNQQAVCYPLDMRNAVRNSDSGDNCGLGIGENGQPSFTITADYQHALCVENRPNDSRIKIKDDGIVQTLDHRMGAGGGNCPMVAIAVQGSQIGRSNGNGPMGKGYNEDVAYTLNSVDGGGAVCYQEIVSPITTEDAHQTGNQGQQGDPSRADRHLVVEKSPTYAMTTGSFTQVTENVSPTLMSRDWKDAPCVGTFGNNGFGRWNEKPAPLKAQGGDYLGGENLVVEPEYVVRRLTPTECAVLQGFPRGWCDNLGTAEPSENEIDFFTHVWEQWGKPKNRKAIIKWLNNPRSDSAEYKLWGNGVCLGCVTYVLNAINTLSI